MDTGIHQTKKDLVKNCAQLYEVTTYSAKAGNFLEPISTLQALPAESGFWEVAQT